MLRATAFPHAYPGRRGCCPPGSPKAGRATLGGAAIVPPGAVTAARQTTPVVIVIAARVLSLTMDTAAITCRTMQLDRHRLQFVLEGGRAAVLEVRFEKPVGQHRRRGPDLARRLRGLPRRRDRRGSRRLSSSLRRAGGTLSLSESDLVAVGAEFRQYDDLEVGPLAADGASDPATGATARDPGGDAAPTAFKSVATAERWLHAFAPGGSQGVTPQDRPCSSAAAPVRHEG